jgi:processing peptidase subunit beta
VDYAAEVPLDLTCRYTGSDVRVRDDGMPLAHVALAVEGSIIQDQSEKSK